MGPNERSYRAQHAARYRREHVVDRIRAHRGQIRVESNLIHCTS